MIILIDNYDSFSYNLYQLAGSVEPDVRVIRNDRYTVQEIAEMEPEALILSPGPGRPENAGICIEAVRYFTGRIPILGVCLGHQAICEAFGGKVSYAGEEALKITAESEEGEIMAVEHREFPVFGVQFHPESVMTPQGRRIIENFMKTAEKRPGDGK